MTTRDIAAELLASGVEVDRRRIVLHEPIKTLGDFDVTIKLGQGVHAGIKVSVEPDEAGAELIAQAAAQAGEPVAIREEHADNDAE